MLHVRSKDDLGHPVRLAHLGMAHAATDWRRRLLRRRSTGIVGFARLVVRTVATGPVLALIGGVAITGVLTAVAISDRYAGFGLVLFSPIFVPLITAALLAGRGLLGLGGRLPEAMRTAMLTRSLCPTCGYGLAGVPSDDAGMVGCPECGACWERAEVGRVGKRIAEVVVIADVGSMDGPEAERARASAENPRPRTGPTLKPAQGPAETAP